MVQVAATCGAAKSPEEYATCANTVISSVAAVEVDKLKNDVKRAREAAKAATSDAASSVFTAPPAPVCPQAGQPGLVECELGKRAFAACADSTSNADFSQCVRTFVSTKPFNCAIAANAEAQGNCKKANLLRAK